MRLVLVFCFSFVLFSPLSWAATEASTAPSNPELGVGKTYGDWTEYCEKGANDTEICNISQTLTRQGSQQLLLSIRVNYVPGKKLPLVFATIPLGGLLTYSPLFKVGQGKPLKLAYQFCDISGCTAVAVLTAEIVSSLEKESQAVVQYVSIARKAIGIPVSLKGFRRGLKTLTRKRTTK